MNIDENQLSAFNFKQAPHAHAAAPASESDWSMSGYAGIAAVTHSCALVVGQLLFSYSSSKAWSLPARLLFTLLSITLAFHLLQLFFSQQFESKAGLVYEQASLFFYDKPNSSSFFSIFSSCSYTIWLLAGYLVRSTSATHVGIFPEYLQRHVVTILGLLMASYAALYLLVFPLWFSLMKPMMQAEANTPFLTEDHFKEFSAIATLSHTVAVALGLFFTKSAPAMVTAVPDYLKTVLNSSPYMPFTLLKDTTKKIALHPLTLTTLSLAVLLSYFLPSTSDVLRWMAYYTFDYMIFKATSFCAAVEQLASGGNLFSVTVMVVFYSGLVSMGLIVHATARTFTESIKEHAAKEHATKAGFKVTDEIIQNSRDNSYQNVVTKSGGADGMLHTALWLSVLSFFGSPAGVFCVYGILHICSGLKTPQTIIEKPLLTFFQSTAITSWGSIITFIPFARTWDKLYQNHPELRCQQDKSHNVEGLNRLEVYLAVGNLILAAALSSFVAVVHLCHPGVDKIYFDNPFTTLASVLYLVLSTAMFFVWIDLWAYVAHRMMHFPWMYRHVHKLHHKWKQTTAFTALALHPFEFFSLTGGVYVGLYVIPLHPAAITVNLLYIHYHNVVDHSGIYTESSLPWQPSSLFHDDHHRHFHVNYGQSLATWDKIGGTFWENGKKYGVKNFSD
jgi:sterol desaturase/sphingolipid hydroxylase (fatty acid hydroxylase superfamily)